MARVKGVNYDVMENSIESRCALPLWSDKEGTCKHLGGQVSDDRKRDVLGLG